MRVLQHHSFDVDLPHLRRGVLHSAEPKELHLRKVTLLVLDLLALVKGIAAKWVEIDPLVQPKVVNVDPLRHKTVVVLHGKVVSEARTRERRTLLQVDKLASLESKYGDNREDG